jgi:hypothetical protein
MLPKIVISYPYVNASRSTVSEGFDDLMSVRRRFAAGPTLLAYSQTANVPSIELENNRSRIW